MKRVNRWSEVENPQRRVGGFKKIVGFFEDRGAERR
jgi:hypothetical protein